jgi:hypothetical protein
MELIHGRSTYLMDFVVMFPQGYPRALAKRELRSAHRFYGVATHSSNRGSRGFGLWGTLSKDISVPDKQIHASN